MKAPTSTAKDGMAKLSDPTMAGGSSESVGTALAVTGDAADAAKWARSFSAPDAQALGLLGVAEALTPAKNSSRK